MTFAFDTVDRHSDTAVTSNVQCVHTCPAKKGFDLLKSKSDALKVRFRDICKVIYATKVGMSDQSSSAFFSLTQAEYAAG